MIIIGAGLAGLSAALTAASLGEKSVLVSSMHSERAQSVLAQGGINGIPGEEHIRKHYQDTMKAGAGLSDPQAVERLARSAPYIVDWLSSLGVPFSADGEKLALRRMGGHTESRTVFAKDSTGKIIMTTLIDEVRKQEAAGLIKRLPHHRLEKLLIQGESCEGCVVYDRFTGARSQISGSVIIASGGLSGLFDGYSTGSRDNDGAAAAELFSQGVKFSNLEFIQFHPTTIAIEGKRCLISEAARSEGGRLFVKRPGARWYFMEEKNQTLKNLAPRDEICREMVFAQEKDGSENQVYLDMETVSEDIWEKRLAGIRTECITYLGIDPRREPIPVEPGIHYFMGAILTDEFHRTNFRHLYAAGECSCQYHGANRLGGNSLLGAIFGGITAAKQAQKEKKKEVCVDDLSGRKEDSENQRIRKRLADCLWRGLGIVRSEEKIKEALAELENLKKEAACLTDKERIHLGTAMLLSALKRRESRGAHYREDYPDMEKNYGKSTEASFDGEAVKITFAS